MSNCSVPLYLARYRFPKSAFVKLVERHARASFLADQVVQLEEMLDQFAEAVERVVRNHVEKALAEGIFAIRASGKPAQRQ
jgi:hypothetical protein